VSESATVKRSKRSVFFWIRVSILLFILFVVSLYAIKDLRSRRGRNAWDRTLDVALVVVHVDGTPAVDPDAVRVLEERLPALEDRLQAECERHQSCPSAGGLGKPFRIRLKGPVIASAPPPSPKSESAVDLAKQAVEMKKWLGEVDPRAGVEPDQWDSRIYVTVRKPASLMRAFVEGESEQDGRVGTVAVELDASMADLTLIVVTHELMHTLGASDKYDASGRTLVPDGLAEPDRSPLFPQRYAEVMARNRPLSATSETIPQSLDELAVGPKTATEIGWRK
jgi:hypothetical protein